MQFFAFTTVLAVMCLFGGTLAAPFATAENTAVGEVFNATAPAEALALAESAPAIKGLKQTRGVQLSLCKMVTILHTSNTQIVSTYIFDAQNRLIGLNDNVNVHTVPFYFYSQLTFPAVMYKLDSWPEFWFAGRFNIMGCRSVAGNWACSQTFFC